MTEQDRSHDRAEMPAAGLPAVVSLFTQACEAFGRTLGRSDEVFDATDFTGSIHELGFEAGRVHALGQALMVLTGSTEWERQAREVLAEYLQSSTLPEEEPGIV